MGIAGLFKTIAIILFIYFIFKVVRRVFIPLFFRGYVKNLGDQVNRQQEEMLRRQQKKKEGDVTVNYQSKSNKNFGRDDGDYIDFEEIK